MAISIYYVPAKELVPGPEVTAIGRKLWSLGLPFFEADDVGDLPDPPYDVELIYEDMAITFSDLGDPVPNCIGDLRCPHCDQDVLHEAYEAWHPETSTIATALRTFPCPHCSTQIGGTDLRSWESYTFAKSYLYISDIDPAEWPDQVKDDIEEIIGPCQEYRESA